MLHLTLNNEKLPRRVNGREHGTTEDESMAHGNATRERHPSVASYPETALGKNRSDWISFSDVSELVDIGHLESAIKLLEPIFQNVEDALNARIDALEARVAELEGS